MSPTKVAPSETCAWGDCPQPPEFRFEGKPYCGWHYGPLNERLGIGKVDELV